MGMVAKDQFPIEVSTETFVGPTGGDGTRRKLVMPVRCDECPHDRATVETREHSTIPEIVTTVRCNVCDETEFPHVSLETFTERDRVGQHFHGAVCDQCGKTHTIAELGMNCHGPVCGGTIVEL